MKQSHRRGTRKKSRRTKGSAKRVNLIWGVFALLFSSLMVLGSTYAWFTSADSATNKFEGSRFEAEITEVFQPNLTWQPGTDTTKQIRVQNTGRVPALVRLSLYEYFLSFKVDVTDKTGNGDLIKALKEVKPTVVVGDHATWQPAVDKGGTYDVKGSYYVANQAFIADQTNGKDRYKLNNASRSTQPFQYVTLNFSSGMNPTPPPAGTKNYWLYADGYFYYSELLQPGKISEPLLDSVTLSLSAPNAYKGALYQLTPYLEAHDTTSAISSQWGIGTSGPVYDMIKGYLGK